MIRPQWWLVAPAIQHEGYPDAKGRPIPFAGAWVDVSPYIQDAVRRGKLLRVDIKYYY